MVATRPGVSEPIEVASAPDPFRLDDIHPSIRGESRRSIPSRLSSYEFRAYRRSDRTIILHMRAMLLIETPVTFGDSYLSGMTAALRISSGQQFLPESLSIASDLSVPFDGETMAVDVWLPVPTGLVELRPGFASLDLRVGWALTGVPVEARVRSKVVVRRVQGR